MSKEYLPLHKEFGIFCFGWFGAITIIFLAKFAVSDMELIPFLADSLSAIGYATLAGIALFIGIFFKRTVFIWYE